MSSEEDARRMYELLKIEDRSFKEFWANFCSEHLKLFWVRNTTGVDRLFLAENAELALYLAVSNGDLRHVRNGSAREVDEAYLARHHALLSAVRKAIQAGRPGAVYPQSDDSIRVGNEVYTPLHVVGTR